MTFRAALRFASVLTATTVLAIGQSFAARTLPTLQKPAQHVRSLKNGQVEAQVAR